MDGLLVESSVRKGRKVCVVCDFVAVRNSEVRRHVEQRHVVHSGRHCLPFDERRLLQRFELQDAEVVVGVQTQRCLKRHGASQCDDTDGDDDRHGGSDAAARKRKYF